VNGILIYFLNKQTMKKLKDKYLYYVGALVLLVVAPLVTFASSDIRASFRSVANLNVPNLQVPTVVEIPVPAYIETERHIGIYNSTENIFIPYELRRSVSRAVPVHVSSYGMSDIQLDGLVDYDSDTSVDFLLSDATLNESIVTVMYSFDAPITSDTLRMSLSQYAVLPKNVSVRALVDGVMQRVVANISPNTNTVTFPELTAKQWEVTLEYEQPLRFTELSFVNKNVVVDASAVRFLAHPDRQYQLFHNPEVIIAQEVGERPNLLSATDIISGTLSEDRVNIQYTPADSDGDTIIDTKDNCPRVANTDQVDLNGNSRGDACDDFDRDGIINQQDNCVDAPNRDQADIDRDGIGDTCDGEESRVTEKYPWMVWVAIIFAALIFVGLFIVALRHQEPEEPAA